MPFTVSLNGPDNVGKTTQLGLLPSHFTVFKVGGLHHTDAKIGELQRQGLFKDWWWQSSPEEFVCTFFGALARRYWTAIDNDNADVVIFDRGVAMFEAVAVAVIAIKNGHDDLDKARSTLQAIVDDNHLRVPYEKLAILMTHGADLEDSVKLTMSREPDPRDGRYTLYQQFLQAELKNQEAKGAYQYTVSVTEADTQGDTQDEIRQTVLKQTGNKLFLPMLHTMNSIYGFAGLSESGKSTLAEAFCAHFGSEQAFRAKIVYFNNAVSERLGKSVYDLPEKEQAFHLFHELERFSRAHYWLHLITIESLHRYTVTKWLKEWLGRKFQIVYIDTDDEKRLSRSLVSHEELVTNDKLKLERGLNRILSEANLVLDNSGTLADSLASLLLFAVGTGRNSMAWNT